jgi:hypothetical protein
VRRVTGRAWKNFHLAMTFGWAVLLVPTLLWWRESVLWVALMSLYANVAGHWAAYQAARAEKKEDDRRDERG